MVIRGIWQRLLAPLVILFMVLLASLLIAQTANAQESNENTDNQYMYCVSRTGSDVGPVYYSDVVRFSSDGDYRSNQSEFGKHVARSHFHGNSQAMHTVCYEGSQSEMEFKRDGRIRRFHIQGVSEQQIGFLAVRNANDQRTSTNKNRGAAADRTTTGLNGREGCGKDEACKVTKVTALSTYPNSIITCEMASTTANGNDVTVISVTNIDDYDSIVAGWSSRIGNNIYPKIVQNLQNSKDSIIKACRRSASDGGAAGRNNPGPWTSVYQ